MTDKIELPDIERMFELIDDIKDLTKKKIFMEIKLKVEESAINKQANSDPKYYQKDKPPSQTFIDNTFKFTGFDDELIPIRKELADVTADLESKKLLFQTYKLVIDLWRTQTANERITMQWTDGM